VGREKRKNGHYLGGGKPRFTNSEGEDERYLKGKGGKYLLLLLPLRYIKREGQTFWKEERNSPYGYDPQLKK